MTTKERIDDFLAQRNVAVVGASRSSGKFGGMAFKELKANGYNVLPVNPNADSIDGERCYAGLKDLPEGVSGVLISVPPAVTEKIVHDAAETGIHRIWIQQGAESDAAVRFCEENGINVVHGECILMFLKGAAFFHRAHRWVWKILGKLPR